MLRAKEGTLLAYEDFQVEVENVVEHVVSGALHSYTSNKSIYTYSVVISYLLSI